MTRLHTQAISVGLGALSGDAPPRHLAAEIPALLPEPWANIKLAGLCGALKSLTAGCKFAARRQPGS